jgi:hypothetical protein
MPAHPVAMNTVATLPKDINICTPPARALSATTSRDALRNTLRRSASAGPREVAFASHHPDAGQAGLRRSLPRHRQGAGAAVSRLQSRPRQLQGQSRFYPGRDGISGGGCFEDYLQRQWRHTTPMLKMRQARTSFCPALRHDRRSYCLPRGRNRGLMQHRKEPSLLAFLYQ